MGFWFEFFVGQLKSMNFLHNFLMGYVVKMIFFELLKGVPHSLCLFVAQGRELYQNSHKHTEPRA